MQQLCIYFVDKFLLGFRVGARVLRGDVFRLRVIGGDDGTLALQFGLLQFLKIPAGLKNARGY